MNRIKKLKQVSKKLEAFEPYETDEKGDRVIRLHVNDSDTFLSPLSIENVPVISDETAHLLNFYLKNMSVDHDERLIFQISGHDFSEVEKDIYKKAIRNYYQEEFIDVQEQFRDNAKSTIWMVLVGLAIISFQVAMRLWFGVTQIFLEVIDIAGWVFLWESVNLLFMRRPQLRKKQLQNVKILDAEFLFQEKRLPEDEIRFAIQKLEEWGDDLLEYRESAEEGPDLFSALQAVPV